MSGEIRWRDADERRLRDRGGGSPPGLAEVMREITESACQEIVELVRRRKADLNRRIRNKASRRRK
jgi:hypothetical protein